MKITVLGAGLVGTPMALDLAKESTFDVLVADVRAEPLEALGAQAPRIRTKRVDLSQPADLRALVSDADIVLSAVPGFMGYETLKTLLEEGKRVVDIAFFAEDPLTLDALAKTRGAMAIVDMGVGPGMSSVLIAHAHSQLDETTNIITYVGGLPKVRRWPYEYAAVFSPIDVIEEYVRPARYIENGVMVTRPALSDAEYLQFPEVGTLEAFNTDGLRTMAQTLKVPNMKEKTLRYPGHYDLMRGFKDAGLFSEEEIEVGGKRLRPRDVTAAIMFPKWTYGPGEEDLTVMRIIAEGVRAGKRERVTWDLADHFHTATGATSMSRTTGLACTTVARMVAAGSITRRGVVVPERLGEQGVLPEVVRALRAKGIVYTRTSESIA